jgi:hypothetical protein
MVEESDIKYDEVARKLAMVRSEQALYQTWTSAGIFQGGGDNFFASVKLTFWGN